VAGVASSAKGALLAGGAALAGVAGAVVVAKSNRGSRKVLGIPMGSRGGLKSLMPNGSIKSDAKSVAGKVNNAAKRADKLGQRVSSVASSVQQVAGAAEEGAKKA
jgi:hypothetical protein